MKYAAAGSALVTFWYAMGDRLSGTAISGSPEWLWMTLWGVALIGFATAVRPRAARSRANDDETVRVFMMKSDVTSSGGAHCGGGVTR